MPIADCVATAAGISIGLLFYLFIIAAIVLIVTVIIIVIVFSNWRETKVLLPRWFY